MNTREDCYPDYGDHGPQKRPASVRQIEAGQKQIEADAADAKACLRLFDALAFVGSNATAISYQTMGQYRTALLRILSGDGPETTVQAVGNKISADALPDIFVCFFADRALPRRYMRAGINSWDVHMWNQGLVFFENITDDWALGNYYNALQVFAMVTPDEGLR